MLKNKPKVFVGMSGGVDSSLAAYLLKKSGYDVFGVFIKSYNLDGCAVKDQEDARLVAEQIGIPFYVFDFEKEYKKEVVDYLIEGYKKGITPNPDVVCNSAIKFGLFFKKAKSLGADFIATGHYAQIKYDRNKKAHLFAGVDKNKDQSYFLWQIKKEVLQFLLFPVGKFLKSQVREMAKGAGLLTSEKKDSQGICFLGKVNLFDFLKKYIPLEKGKIITTSGEVVGEHNGLFFYTIGQRHLGANINSKNTQRKPFYVAQKDFKNNTLIVAEGANHPALFQKQVFLENLNFLSDDFKKFQNKVFLRIRYRQPLFEAKIKDLNLKANSCWVDFLDPQKFVAPGQSAVFYTPKGEVLGGGIIA